MKHNYNGFTGEDFDSYQIYQIHKAERFGLTREQIEVFAFPKIHGGIMRYAMIDLMAGYSIEQIKLYVNKKYTPDQALEISVGLNNGLTIEQVKTYADPDLSWRGMERKRLYLLKENGLG